MHLIGHFADTLGPSLVQALIPSIFAWEGGCFGAQRSSTFSLTLGPACMRDGSRLHASLEMKMLHKHWEAHLLSFSSARCTHKKKKKRASRTLSINLNMCHIATAALVTLATVERGARVFTLIDYLDVRWRHCTKHIRGWVAAMSSLFTQIDIIRSVARCEQGRPWGPLQQTLVPSSLATMGCAPEWADDGDPPQTTLGLEVPSHWRLSKKTPG